MATLTPEEFLLGTKQEAPAPQPLSLTPATDAALSSAKDVYVPKFDFSQLMGQVPEGKNAIAKGFTITPSLDFQARNQRLTTTGQPIPIDVKTGIGAGDYLRVAEQRGPAAQLAVLKDLYPDKNPRMLDNGDLAIQVDDLKTGATKDVVLNPHGMDAHDLIDLAVQTPEIAASAAAAIATKGTGFIRTAAQILASALAGGAVGAIRDVTARASEGIPIDPKEIATARGEQAALDAFGQTALTAGAKALRVISPFAGEAKPGSLEFDLQRGREFAKEVFGENFPITPAEKTGSTALKSIESIESPQPGARTVMSNIRTEGNAVIQRIQARALGKVTAEEDIGTNAIDTLRANVVTPLETALQTARETATKLGEHRVVNQIDAAIGLPTSQNRFTQTMAGAKTLEQFDAKLTAAHEAVAKAYADVHALPGGTGDILNGDAAAQAAQEIRKELPTALREVKHDTGLVDASGNPLTDTRIKREVVSSGVPEGLLKSLTDLESLKGTKVSLQTLTTLKNAAFDEIAKTEAVPGLKDRWFKKVANAYSQGIESGVAETGDPALKAALSNAKETYKKQLLPFDRPGLRELARSEFDAGKLSEEQVFHRFFDGPKAIENMNMLKETLGPNNPAIKALKRGWVDTKLATVTDPVTGSMDAKALTTILDDMRINKPELAKEIFGNNYEELAQTLKIQSAFHKLDTLDSAEIHTLLGLKNPGAKDLEAVLLTQRNRDTAYVNSIVRDVADGLPVASKLQPTEFVKRLRNTTTPTKDVQEVLAQLPANQREAIATAQMYQILNDSSLTEAATATRSLTDNPLNISASKLKEAIGRGNTPEQLRNRLLLGDTEIAKGATRMDVLENLIKLTAPREAKNQLMASTGGLAGASATLTLLKDPLKYASSYVKKAIFAATYTSETGVNAVGNSLMSPARTAAAANALIASEPFIRRMVETYGSDKAKSIISAAKTSIDRTVQGLMAERKADTPVNRERQAMEDFLKGAPSPTRITPIR